MNKPTEVARSINQGPVEDGRRAQERPNQRRLERIGIYKAIIGYGHERILELGCGSGDLAYALVDHADGIVATDIDAEDIELARRREGLWSLSDKQISKIAFKTMSSLQLDFPDSMFDWAISTSMVEHLDPEDVERHLREARRVLKAGGNYLIWCPNGLGHHEDQAGHLTMWSFREWIEKLRTQAFNNSARR
jgi:ubiquinone/menaquinone biosynthesis C-methylase UbiE